MKMKPFFVILSLFVPAAASLAGERIPLDKDFSFRLEQPAPETPSSKLFPAAPSQPENNRPGPTQTPEGERLPPGSRAFEFNGQPYYIIPLRA